VQSIAQQKFGRASEPDDTGKIIVEHTNINPNKAAHIGHLRNAALGDSFVRCLRFLGHDVEVQNYLDNTGVQVADVVVGLERMEGMSLQEVQAIEGKFDYYCWDVYARVSEFYKQSEENKKFRSLTLQSVSRAIIRPRSWPSMSPCASLKPIWRPWSASMCSTIYSRARARSFIFISGRRLTSC